MAHLVDDSAGLAEALRALIGEAELMEGLR